MTMGQTTFIDLPEELAEASNSACNKSPFRPSGADKCKLRSLHQVENVILSVRHFAARSFASLGATRQALHCKASSYGRARYAHTFRCLESRPVVPERGIVDGTSVAAVPQRYFSSVLRFPHRVSCAVGLGRGELSAELRCHSHD